jgi:hypothetical protein
MPGTTYNTVKQTELALVVRLGEEFDWEKFGNVMNVGVGSLPTQVNIN